MAGTDLPKGAEVIVCPPEAFLNWPEWDMLPVTLGAQDATEKTLANPKVKYCLVGHSDRRKLGEGEDIIAQKIAALLAKNITPLLCFSKLSQIKEYRSYTTYKTYIFCYEPPENISQGGQFKAVDLEKVKKELTQYKKDLEPEATLLYGGSVNAQNIKPLAKIPLLSGFLVGQASLNYQDFINLINAI